MTWTVPKPVSGIDLKVQILTDVIAWELFGDPEAESIELSDEDMALCRRTADSCVMALEGLKDD